jgi:hypothetical protein
MNVVFFFPEGERFERLEGDGDSLRGLNCALRLSKNCGFSPLTDPIVADPEPLSERLLPFASSSKGVFAPNCMAESRRCPLEDNCGIFHYAEKRKGTQKKRG